MRNRCGKINMTHALAANYRACDFDSTLLTYNSFVANTFVFSTVTFEITLRTKDALVKESIFLTALGTIVDRLGFCYLSE